MSLGPEDINEIRAVVLPRLVRVTTWQSVAIVLLVLCQAVTIWLGMTKAPQILAITDTGRVIPLVPLDKPYVGDARVVGFADECVRMAFSHDFLNFRHSLSQAKTCFTGSGGGSFDEAIAPLIQIWVGIENVETALVLLAFIAAFFPVLSNMTIGLRAADRGLMDLFRLHGAGRIQTFFRLQLPASLPFLLSGMKVSGGLSVIGLVVAEFVAGSGQSGGLAWRIIEAGNRLQVARMFAALVLITVTGVALFALMAVLSKWALGSWHESEQVHE